MFNLILLLLFTTAISKASKKPHIIFIVADDLGWNDVSWHNSDMLTPNLERLAREGVILNQSYVQPVCTPSRTAFMSGYYPFRVGRQNSVIDHLEPTGLSVNLTLLPERLKKLGYSTHIVGKWHLGFCNWSYTPTHRGFDSFFGYYGGSEDYYTHSSTANDKTFKENSQKNTNNQYLDFRNNTKPSRNYKGIYSPVVFAKAVNVLLSSSDPNQPLFLYLPFQSVHAPLQVPKKWEDKYRNIENNNRRKYCGMVTAMDDAVGKIIAALKKYGFFNNSMIIFTTDNGGQTKAGGNNWPLRGNKATLWEGGTRGAAFVYGSILQKKSYINNKLIHAVDWYPTILHLAGSGKNEKIDGINQWDVITNNGPSARSEFVYNIYDHPQRRAAIRVGDYKLIWGHPGNPSGWIPPPKENEPTKSCNLPFKSSTLAVRLYNIREDPTERHNLAEMMPKVAELLKKKIVMYSKQMVRADDPRDDPNGDPIYWNNTFTPGWCVAR